MYNSDTEVLFPLRLIPTLQFLRGEEWNQLIEYLATPVSSFTDRAGFVLMMVRLSGCVACNSDSFRAMHGCTQCSHQVIRRFRSEDKELISLYNQARQDIEIYLDQQQSK